MTIEKQIQKLAKECGFAGAKDYKSTFNAMQVYVAYYSEVLYTGIPQFILVSADGQVRLAQPNENEYILTH